MLPDLTLHWCQVGWKGGFLQAARLQFPGSPHPAPASHTPVLQAPTPPFPPQHYARDFNLLSPEVWMAFTYFLILWRMAWSLSKLCKARGYRAYQSYTTPLWSTHCWQMFSTAARVPKFGQMPVTGALAKMGSKFHVALGLILATSLILLPHLAAQCFSEWLEKGQKLLFFLILLPWFCFWMTEIDNTV